MKIVHVAETIRGGPATYLDTVVPLQIRDLGPDEVACIVPREHVDDLVHVPAVCTRLISHNRRPGNLVRSLLRIRRMLRDEQPDILHVHSSFAGMLVRLPYLVLLGRRPPLVYCAHAWSFTMEVPQWKRQLYGFIERVLARPTDAIINISDFEVQAAIAAGIPASKCVRIYNGVRDVPADADGVPRDTPLDPRCLNLLFVGRFDLQKGLDILLLAMRRVERADLRLYLVGAQVRSTDDTPDLPANVVSLGWLAPDQLDTYYRAANAVVVPSRWEGFSLVAAEAMRNGTPVICSDRGALPEVVADGESGIVFALDPPERLVELLAALDRERLAHMRPAARARFVELFTDEAMHQQLMALYREVLSAHRVKPDPRLRLPVAGLAAQRGRRPMRTLGRPVYSVAANTPNSAAISAPVLPSAASSSARRNLRTMSSADCRFRPACVASPLQPDIEQQDSKPSWTDSAGTRHGVELPARR